MKGGREPHMDKCKCPFINQTTCILSMFISQPPTVKWNRLQWDILFKLYAIPWFKGSLVFMRMLFILEIHVTFISVSLV